MDHFIELVKKMVHLGGPFCIETSGSRHCLVAVNISTRKTLGAIKHKGCLSTWYQ
jgi:hypothetical protein